MAFGGILEKFRRKRAIVWQKFTIFVEYEKVFAGDIGGSAAWWYGTRRSSWCANRVWRGGGCGLSALQVRYGSVSSADEGQYGLCGGYTYGLAHCGNTRRAARDYLLVPQTQPREQQAELLNRCKVQHVANSAARIAATADCKV